MEKHGTFTQKHAPYTGYTFGTGAVRVKYVLFSTKVFQVPKIKHYQKALSSKKIMFNRGKTTND